MTKPRTILRCAAVLLSIVGMLIVAAKLLRSDARLSHDEVAALDGHRIVMASGAAGVVRIFSVAGDRLKLTDLKLDRNLFVLGVCAIDADTYINLGATTPSEMHAAGIYRVDLTTGATRPVLLAQAQDLRVGHQIAALGGSIVFATDGGLAIIDPESPNVWRWLVQSPSITRQARFGAIGKEEIVVCDGQIAQRFTDQGDSLPWPIGAPLFNEVISDRGLVFGVTAKNRVFRCAPGRNWSAIPSPAGSVVGVHEFGPMRFFLCDTWGYWSSIRSSDDRIYLRKLPACFQATSISN